jgi:hypothetical protein
VFGIAALIVLLVFGVTLWTLLVVLFSGSGRLDDAAKVSG